MNHLFLFKIVLLSYLLHYQPCEAASGMTFDDSKKPSLRVRSLGRNRVFPLYAVPPVEDLTSTLTTMPTADGEFWKEEILLKALEGQGVMLLAFIFLFTGIGDFKTDVLKEIYTLDKAIALMGKDIALMCKDIGKDLTDIKTNMAQQGKDLTDIRTNMAQLDKDITELKSDTKSIGATINLMKATQENQNEKM